MTGPVFFSEKLDQAIEGKEPGEQLDIIAKMITDAEFDKAAGYGPPQDAINQARRRWLAIYDEHFAPILINPKEKSCVTF